MAYVRTTPTLHDELTRKTFETLDWLCTSVESGHLTKAQAHTGITTLFMSVSGLVDDEFKELVTNASQLVEGAENVEARHLIKGNQIVSFKRMAGYPEFWMTARVQGVPVQAPVTKTFRTPKQAMEEMERLINVMKARGFTEL